MEIQPRNCISVYFSISQSYLVINTKQKKYTIALFVL